jgi:multidrug efflux system membrane fusion protein
LARAVVNIRLLIDTLKQVVVIPDRRGAAGAERHLRLRRQDDSTVTMRPITVQKQDETQTVAKSGLEPGERVVTTGFVRLTDGSKVSVGSATAPAAQRARSAPRDGQKRQRGGSNTRPNSQQ